MHNKARKEIIRRMKEVQERIGGGQARAVMRETPEGDWLKEAQMPEGQSQDYLRGYYDGLQAALEIMEQKQEDGDEGTE